MARHKKQWRQPVLLVVERESLFMRTRRYSGGSRDPHWTEVRFNMRCGRCGAAIAGGERTFYYPLGRIYYCRAEECGRQASRDFEAARADEG